MKKSRIFKRQISDRWRYGLAIATVTIALLLTLILRPLLEPTVFALFYPAVLISALRGGRKPGLLAIALSLVFTRYFLMTPPHTLIIASLNDFVQLTLNAAVLLLIYFISIDLCTSRRQAEKRLEQLQNNENRFQLALKSVAITLLQQDADLRYQWIDNPQNYPVASVLEKTDYDLFPLADAEQLTAIKRRVLESGISTQEEVQITVGNQLRYYDLRVEPISDDWGHSTGIFCAAVDITDYQRTKNELQERDSRFRRLIESNLFGVSIGLLDGGILEANSALLDMMGYTYEELTAQPLSWEQITPPEYLPLDAKAGDELRRNGVFTPFEKEYVRRDGIRVPVLIGGALLQEAPDQPQKVICFHLDLRELRHTATELRRAKERFELATSAVKGLVYEWNPRTNLVDRTRGMVDIVGYTPEEADPSADWWFQRIHPEDQSRLQHMVDRVHQQKAETFGIDYRVRHRDGDYRYVWDQARIYRNKAGDVVRTLGFSLDISDRKRAEDALRESEARFRAVADTAPVLIWMSGIDKLCNYFNQTWFTFTGRTLEQEMGNGWIEGVYSEDRQRCLEIYGTAFDAHQPFTMEYRLRREDGEYRWVLDNGIPRFTPDGSFLGYIGSCLDISDRKRTEEIQTYLMEASEVLANSLDYQTTLTNLSHLTVPRLADWCSIHICEEDGSVQELAVAHVNPEKLAWAAEFRRKYPINLNDSWGVALVLQTGQSALYPHVSDEMLAEAAHDTDYLRLLQELKLCSVMIVPLQIHTHILGSISFIFAESGRHYTQADLSLAEELARRAALAVENARLYRSAQRDRAKAEAANHSKDEFLATLSHELRTPLNAMLGWMQMLTTRQMDEAATQRALDTIYRNTRSLYAIIKDLLDISSITSGKLRLHLQPIDLVPIITAAMEAVYPAAIAKSITLQFHLEDPPHSPHLPNIPSPQPRSDFGMSAQSNAERDSTEPLAEVSRRSPTPETLRLSAHVEAQPPHLILADPDRLQQVIWNLLSNAVKFTPPEGQVHVHISNLIPSPLPDLLPNSHPPTSNTLSLLPNSQYPTPNTQHPFAYAQIQVTDTGIGIDPNFLPYVFDRFSQADMTTTKTHGGLGLGLAIVRNLVEMQGGVVQVHSNGLNQGTTFTVRLPLLPTDEPTVVPR